MMQRLNAVVTAILVCCFALGLCTPVPAQDRRHDDDRQPSNRFYDGANRGVRGGDYGRDRRRYDDRHDSNQGGIGPGKGALIGGAAGAALGAIFGGGVKGSLITGAAGAGIGAVVGQSAQNNRDRDHHYRR